MSDLLREKALAARDRPSPYGEDVNISSFEVPTSVREIDVSDRERMKSVGLEPEIEGRSGTFVQVNQKVLESLSKIPGLTIMSMEQAREKGLTEGLEWNLISPGKDKYTSAAYLNSTNGYFIHVTGKIPFPFQSCLFIGTEKGVQYVHNIIKLEPGAELDIITGCTTGKAVRRGLHIGITEMYIGEGAKLDYTMLHEWGEDLFVRPRSAAVVEKGGSYTSTYISLHKVRSVQMYPSVILKGEGSSAQLNSVVIAPEGAEIDIGGAVVLMGKNTNAEIISRTVSSGGRSIARGQLIGKETGAVAHMECNGIFLTDKGLIHAVPELSSERKDVEMSHEASVGRVAKEQVEYLMSRGLTEAQATSAIVRGFLQPSIKNLPPSIMAQVKAIIESEEGM